MGGDVGLRGSAAARAPQSEPTGGERLVPIQLKQVHLGGEFGRRISQIIENDILRVDVEKTFLDQFRERPAEPFPYLGFGKFLDAVVRLAAHRGDPRLLALKRRMSRRTPRDPGYRRLHRLGQRTRGGESGNCGTSTNARTLIWALVSDYRLHGEQASLEAARKIADNIIRRFLADTKLRPDTVNGVVTFEGSSLGFDRALLALSQETKDPKYREFCIRVLRLPEYDPPIKTGPTSLANHAYTYLGHSLAQLDLYRVTWEPDLLRAPKRAVNFSRGDGMLVTGSCSEAECWHDTQSGLQNTAETCMSTTSFA